MRMKNSVIRAIAIVAIMSCMGVNALAANSEEHRKDIQNVLFNGKVEERDLNQKQKDVLEIISKALAFAVDENGNPSHRDSYDDFVNTIKKKHISVGNRFPAFGEDIFPSIGAGTHRKYCHQGFWKEYTQADVDYPERWANARDRILIPAVGVALDLDISKPEEKMRAEVIAMIAYYIHIARDITGDVTYMSEMDTYPKMFNELRADLKKTVAESKNSNIRNYTFPKVISITDADKAIELMKDRLYTLVVETVDNPDIAPEQRLWNKILDWFSRSA